MNAINSNEQMIQKINEVLQTKKDAVVNIVNDKLTISVFSLLEKNLKNELWLCHKHMDLSMEDLYNMTVNDRKRYILIHNNQVEKEKERLDKIKSKK